MMMSSNGNICRITGPLREEFTGHRLIPLTKASTEYICSIDIFVDLRQNKRLNKQSRCRWFEMPLRSLSCHFYESGLVADVINLKVMFHNVVFPVTKYYLLSWNNSSEICDYFTFIQIRVCVSRSALECHICTNQTYLLSLILFFERHEKYAILLKIIISKHSLILLKMFAYFTSNCPTAMAHLLTGTNFIPNMDK